MLGGVMCSRMLARLDDAVASAASPLEVDCKRAERAAYQARLGMSEEARAELDRLRQQYGSRPAVAMSAWLHLVDGLIAHFGDMSDESRIKILRAHALSSAAGLVRTQALSAAWLAHMDYRRLNVAAMARHATEALELSTERDHSARSRAALVFAQAYHFAGRLDLALPWYASTRSHAVAEGDDATLTSLMHNMAWLRAQYLRVRDCGLTTASSGLDEDALLAAQPLEGFDLLIGSSSLPALAPALRAQVLTVNSQYAEALALFDAELTPGARRDKLPARPDLLADRAWCHASLGHQAAATQDAERAEAGIQPGAHLGDLALVHARLSQTFGMLDRPEPAAIHRQRASEAWSVLEGVQRQILEALHDLPPPKSWGG